MSLEPLLTASPVIQLHLAAALAALVIGTVQFAGAKGTLPHRTLGIAFVATMAVTALSAIFIRSSPDGGFSWIHVFIPLSLFGLVGLVRSVRRAGSRSHRRIVSLLFFGSLIIPGLFAFMPGRLLHTLVTGG